VAIATGHRPLFAAGKRFSYSNTNYILVGLVIQRVTGQRLATQLQQRIVGPLSLGDTEFPATEQAIAPISMGMRLATRTGGWPTGRLGRSMSLR